MAWRDNCLADESKLPIKVDFLQGAFDNVELVVAARDGDAQSGLCRVPSITLGVGGATSNER